MLALDSGGHMQRRPPPSLKRRPHDRRSRWPPCCRLRCPLLAAGRVVQPSPTPSISARRVVPSMTMLSSHGAFSSCTPFLAWPRTSTGPPPSGSSSLDLAAGRPDLASSGMDPLRQTTPAAGLRTRRMPPRLPCIGVASSGLLSPPPPSRWQEGDEGGG